MKTIQIRWNPAGYYEIRVISPVIRGNYEVLLDWQVAELSDIATIAGNSGLTSIVRV